jgi:hypothetical protein
MKKVLSAILLVVLALTLSAAIAVDDVSAQEQAAPVASVQVQDGEPPVSPVELPVELRALISAFIGFLVTAGLKSLSTLLKSDITGWGAVITGALTTSVIFFFNAILSTIPPEAQPSATIALALIVSILAAFGVARTTKKMQPAEKAK